MRILSMLLFTLILGAAGYGAWIMMGSDVPWLLSGKETKQADNPAAQTIGAKQTKWREAPYVILAPAQPLPEKQSAAPPPPEPAKLKVAAVSAAAPPAPSPPAAKSSIAKLALEAVIGPQASRQTKAGTEPQPKAPPAAKPRPQAAKEKKKLQLLYKAKAEGRSETILKQQSFLAKEQVRFRKPVPLNSGVLKSEKMTIALIGINGLVADEQCKYASGKSWECGRWGKYALRRLIRGRSVLCDVIQQVTENIVTARCKVAGVDISKWVVRRGWGRPSGKGADKYDVALKAAKKDKLGQWSTEEIAKKN